MYQYFLTLKRDYQLLYYRILITAILVFALGWQYYAQASFCFGCSSVQFLLFLTLFFKKKRSIQLALSASLLVVTFMIYKYYFYQSNVCLISWEHDLPKCSVSATLILGVPFIVWTWLGLSLLLAFSKNWRE